MQIIIAEKPSLARNIAAAIGVGTRRRGYIEGKDYIVTWAFGHLFSLVDIEEYSGSAERRWTMEGLPCIPESFRFELRRGEDKRVDSGVREQFETIKALVNRPDVTAVINAGDADREGEIIVRLCIERALTAPKPQKRLWLPDQTPETVRAALAELSDASEYDRLADEGLARTYIDWLYGTNLTRYATLKTGKFLRIGRVIVPIVRAICERDLLIRNFVPEKYFAVLSREKTNGETVELISKKKFDKDGRAAAEALSAAYNAAGATVTRKTSKAETLYPPKLFSLSTLQSLLGKKHKMSMSDSLEVIQKLYEEGYLTYPRTNSEYLATKEQGKVKQILEKVKGLGYPVAFRFSKSIFDDSKIESHSALTPTFKIPQRDALSERERLVYSTVLRRFVAVFCAEECKVERSELTVRVGELETFTLKGMILLEPGWTKYDEYTKKDKLLPRLEIGDSVALDFRPTEKETAPPKHYTIETLNNYLKNPFREEKQAAAQAAAEAEEGSEAVDDSEDYRAVLEGLELGTEATRTGIIDNARKSKYIALKKDVYSILPDGEYLVASLERLKINMDKFKTAEMGRALKAVYRGSMTVEESVRLAAEEIRAVFEAKGETIGQALGESGQTGSLGEIVGDCPLCGRHIVRGRYRYGCMGYAEGCTFSIPMNLCHRDIPLAAARDLLTDGVTKPIGGFISKKGKPFSARLKLENGKAEFCFEDKGEQRKQGK